MQMDEILCGIAEDVKNFAVIYCVGKLFFILFFNYSYNYSYNL